ncbi:hypothetical protein [Mycolicibacter sinensis]|uniref:hypothetical protein n=1 Tax=Mycolicibacter sinensis (strain JDM601) TaxID=875328 RepID=UPI0007EBB3B3|nr:hypothetical protein [Mycolicibacter sinensis]OBH20800.1 hypothetical protein A5694_15595 [Mycolicibacter sinensis]
MAEYSSTQANFPILDADRSHDDAEYGRQVIVECGYVEPRISETDDWCSLPIRVITDQASGLHIELGPYDLDAADIRDLAGALHAYNQLVRYPMLPEGN